MYCVLSYAVPCVLHVALLPCDWVWPGGPNCLFSIFYKESAVRGEPDRDFFYVKSEYHKAPNTELEKHIE